jgi:ABC-2 type transport system permease protein/lipopolysaccharide transport system permease protein
MAIMIAALGLIYLRLFNMEINRYLPFLRVGLVVWQFVSQMMVDGCQTFLTVQNIIHQVRLPFSVHAWRNVCRNLIIFAHNIVIVPLVLIPFSVPVGWNALVVLPALAILAIDGFWISILLGMLSARYRDIPPIVINFVQVSYRRSSGRPRRWESGRRTCRSIHCSPRSMSSVRHYWASNRCLTPGRFS